MNLTLIEIAKMCGGVLSPDSNESLPINNVIIDSRNAQDNNLFVAITGENHDGHSFVGEVLNKVNAAALVSKTQILKLDVASAKLPNLIYVEDTIKALGQLAGSYRQKFKIPVVGITGSNGKTTVKEMLKSICDVQFGADHVLATSGNYNNNIGMPLSLLRLSSVTKVAIIEMGMNHAKELDYLTHISQPTIAVVNNVFLAHAGFFNAIEDIARAKAEIYHGLLYDGIACINKAEPLYPIFEENVSASNPRFYFGDVESGCYIKSSTPDGVMNVVTAKGELHIQLKLLGSHNQYNALSAIALALNLNCDLTNIEKGLNNFTGYIRRLEKKMAFNGALIIDDSYNANPASVKAAIMAIKNLPKPHWFIFADLRELGKFAKAAHEEIGRFATDKEIDKFLTVGELASIANTTFNGDKLHFASNQDIVKYCRENLPKEATLLIKGSSSTNLKEVVNGLIK